VSGHSKWAGIKHRKAVVDARRGKLFAKRLRGIEVAAREGGGKTESNPTLADAIARARDDSIPADTIERAIKRGTGELEGVTYETLTYEGYAPGGVAVMIRVLTDNRNRTAPEIRHTFEKYGGNMGASGAVAWMFDRKGVIRVDAEKISEDDLLTVALDAGAADMTKVEKAFEITTAPAEMETVRAALEKARVPVLEGEVTFVPQSTVRVEGKEAPTVLRLVEALEDLDDVQAVYANYDIPDEVLEAISAA
jgi:YebC/PmpR family DNA-binding regulatory protein